MMLPAPGNCNARRRGPGRPDACGESIYLWDATSGQNETNAQTAVLRAPLL